MPACMILKQSRICYDETISNRGVHMGEKRYAAMLQFWCKTKFRKDTLLRFCKRTPWLLMIIYACFVAYLAFTKDTRVVFFLVVPAVVLIFVTVLRFLLDKPRPFEVYKIEPLTKHAKGKSCPSRHTASAFIIGMACLYISVPFGILTLCMACIVAVTRVLCGVHFILDVLLGAGISVAIGAIGFYVLPLFITIPAF